MAIERFRVNKRLIDIHELMFYKVPIRKLLLAKGVRAMYAHASDVWNYRSGRWITEHELFRVEKGKVMGVKDCYVDKDEVMVGSFEHTFFSENARHGT